MQKKESTLYLIVNKKMLTAQKMKKSLMETFLCSAGKRFQLYFIIGSLSMLDIIWYSIVRLFALFKMITEYFNPSIIGL